MLSTSRALLSDVFEKLHTLFQLVTLTFFSEGNKWYRLLKDGLWQKSRDMLQRAGWRWKLQIDAQQEKEILNFHKASSLAVAYTNPRIQWMAGHFPRKKKTNRCVKLTNHLNLIPSLRMIGCLTPIRHVPLFPTDGSIYLSPCAIETNMFLNFKAIFLQQWRRY